MKTWHHYRPAMEAAIFADDQAAFAAVVDEALSSKHIKRADGMLIEANEHGRSYLAMSQADMGKLLIQAGLRWGNDKYIKDGRAAMKVLVTDWEDGGLMLRDGATAWYCGQTSRTDKDKGGTLNKHLYATKALLEVGAMLGDEKYIEAGEAGFRKMVKGKDLPRLKDFFVDGDELNNWAYYAVSNADKDKGYYLGADNTNQDEDYHQLDMELLYAIGQKVSDDFNWAPFHKIQVDGYTALGAMNVVDNNLEWHNDVAPDAKDWFGLWS